MTHLSEIEERKPRGILAKLADKYDMSAASLETTLIETIFPDQHATKAQVAALCMVAHEYNLNPLLRQIYAFPGKGGGIIPMVGVDGWYAYAQSNKDFAGIQFEFVEKDGELFSCKCKLWRHNWQVPLELEELLSECKRNTAPWNQQPRRMLRHRAAIQAIRVAFGMSGQDPNDKDIIAETDVAREVVAEIREDEQAAADLKDKYTKPKKKTKKKKAAPPVEPEPEPEEEIVPPPAVQELVEEEDAEPEPEPEPKRKRKKRGITKMQMARAIELLDTEDKHGPLIDSGLISPHLPAGETLEDGFERLTQEDATKLIKRMEAGEFTFKGADEEENGKKAEDPFEL